jgi:L-amino acid N-acyltransferase YncA
MDGTVRVRVASEADGPALAEVERSSPLVFGDRQLIIDREEDYFAAARLMEDATVLVAEDDGKAVGVYCGAWHRAMLGGREIDVMYIHHARIRPEYQRRGVGRAFAEKLNELQRNRPVDTTYFYIGPENAASQAYAKGAANRWSYGPIHLSFACNALAGPPAGRPATAADAPGIVRILNAAHAGEEMFLPYTVESLTARLARAPKQYGWERLWLGEGAVVGVWPEGESAHTRSRIHDGPWKVTRGASVLDYAFLPGAEPQFLALLAAWCGWLSGRGMTALGLFTSEGRRAYELLMPLAPRVDAMDFWTPGIPEPPDARAHGLYADAVYY